MEEIIKRNPKKRQLMYTLYIELYQSAHYTLFMYTSDNRDPHYVIVNTETREEPEILGVDWDDLKDVMDVLEILEEEARREEIGE